MQHELMIRGTSHLKQSNVLPMSGPLGRSRQVDLIGHCSRSAHTSSMRTQRRSAIDFCTASIAWVILWPKAKSGSAGLRLRP